MQVRILPGVPYMNKNTIIIIALFVLTSCSVVVTKVAKIKDINEVTGLYKIGTKRFLLVDSSRTNWYKKGYGDYRKIMTQVWYPSVISETDKKSKYIDNINALTETIKLQGYSIPEILTKQIGSVDCTSWDSSQPVKHETFPIIIFSHGHGGLRTQNTNQIEELVSHGYIVIAPDHTFDSGFIEFPDGEIAYSLTATPYDSTYIETAEIFYTRFGYRTDDIKFILNQILTFNIYDDKIFPIMNQDKIGIFGHSFGGMTSFYSGYHFNQIKSCYALDGWFEFLPDSLTIKNIDKPIFHLGQNNKGDLKFWNDMNFNKLELIMQNNLSSSIMIDIPGSFHYDYTDFTYFSYLSKKLNFSGSVDPTIMANIMNVTLVNFFNKTLKDNKNTVNNYETLFPELNVLYNNN